MLSAHRCLEVDDGSYVYLDPSLAVTWPECMAILTRSRRLRPLYHDQCHVITTDEARILVAEGIAAPVGGRLFEQPGLFEAVFDWDATTEIDHIAALVADVAEGQRGIEYGCGAGRLLLPLRERGFSVDGIDASESTMRWLLGRCVAGTADGPMLVVGDISTCAFPDRYGYAIAGLNTLRYLPHLASLRRHLHLAALSVRPGGKYVIFVDSWTDGAAPAPPGSSQEWWVGDAADRLRIVWSKARQDPTSRVDLECVVVYRGDQEILREYQTQLSLSLREWREVFEGRDEWRVGTIQLDTRPAPRDVAELTGAATGNFWFVLERTGSTAGAVFTR